MLRQSLWIAGVCLAMNVATVRAIDRVKLIEGTPIAGTLISMDPKEVVVEQISKVRKPIPVNTIESIAYEAEPSKLPQVRTFISNQSYAQAREQIKAIDRSEVTRKEVQQDLEFYDAYAAARLAMAGNDQERLEAGKLLLPFEQNHKGSYHYFQACEALGDLLVALKKYSAAEPYYTKLGAAPWPDYKMKAGVLIARSLLAAGDSAGAMKKFDEVLATPGSGKDADAQKQAATLGKATAMANAGQTEPAIKLVEDVINQADANNSDLHARAYNVLGNCYVKAGKKKDALMAFLHVDLLYTGYPEQHAEALAHLSTLWTDVDKADRATRARETLRSNYPNSPWAQK